MSEAAFRDYFGIGQVDARVLAYLRQCSPGARPRSSRAIGLAADIKPSAVETSIFRLREAMNPGAIDAAPSRISTRSYMLTEAGIEECRRAVTEYRKAVAA